MVGPKTGSLYKIFSEGIFSNNQLFQYIMKRTSFFGPPNVQEAYNIIFGWKTASWKYLALWMLKSVLKKKSDKLIIENSWNCIKRDQAWKMQLYPWIQNFNPVTLRSHDMSVVLHWSLEDRRDSEYNNARELDDNKDDNKTRH